jgi:hypothetical protein
VNSPNRGNGFARTLSLTNFYEIGVAREWRGGVLLIIRRVLERTRSEEQEQQS